MVLAPVRGAGFILSVKWLALRAGQSANLLKEKTGLPLPRATSARTCLKKNWI